MKYRDVPTRADQQSFVDAFHEFKDLVARGKIEVPEEKAGYEVFTFSWLMQRLQWQPKWVNLMLRHVRREFHKEQLTKRLSGEAMQVLRAEAKGRVAMTAMAESLSGRQP